MEENITLMSTEPRRNGWWTNGIQEDVWE